MRNCTSVNGLRNRIFRGNIELRDHAANPINSQEAIKGPETFFLHPLIGPVAQSSPGNGVIFTLWTIPRWRVGSK